MSPIAEVIRHDNLDLLACLYPTYKKLPRNTITSGEFQLIHLAAGNEESYKCLEFLLKQGESPNQICNKIDKATPLHFATIDGGTLNMKLLL